MNDQEEALEVSIEDEAKVEAEVKLAKLSPLLEKSKLELFSSPDSASKALKNCLLLLFLSLLAFSSLSSSPLDISSNAFLLLKAANEVVGFFLGCKILLRCHNLT